MRFSQKTNLTLALYTNCTFWYMFFNKKALLSFVKGQCWTWYCREIDIFKDNCKLIGFSKSDTICFIYQFYRYVRFGKFVLHCSESLAFVLKRLNDNIKPFHYKFNISKPRALYTFMNVELDKLKFIIKINCNRGYWSMLAFNLCFF